MTKNLTLAVPDHVLENFRLHAAERRTTVNALIRQHMEEAVGLEARRKAAINKMLELGSQTTARIDMGEWNRAATYDRQGQE
ncbi:MAG: hypothetical protein RLY97_347 [Pseudomonadota bacterium]|jgi:hypothetical protein